MDESFNDHPEIDVDWTDEHWLELLKAAVEAGIVTWGEAASVVLGALNPSQVGTSIASKKTFQRHFPRRKTWAAVRTWYMEQEGHCVDCGTRLGLQADHAIPKEIVSAAAEAVLAEAESPADVSAEVVRVALDRALDGTVDAEDASDESRTLVAQDLSALIQSGEHDVSGLKAAADRLENIVLRCRRCNVVRRPSHSKGGVTHLTAESALMWILLVKRPRTYETFQELCRAYGLTMANIRFEEAWAMARWLHREGLYEIDPSSKYAPPPAELEG